MDRDQILDLLTDAAVEVMDVDRATVTPEARFVEDLNGDSLSVLEILEILQDKLDVDLPTESFDGVGTVGQAADVITKIVNERAESATG
ncbi:MAG TPA: acyl carrier protein [Acidimicrobiales bacterium]|jgi:acyl carrier protein|nr:acyl carrier protein [Acidimicrobiales bacterium]